MPPFTPQWIAFCREARIAGQSISAGLTTLRKANYAATSLYSHAFFSLTIGIERLLKLMFLIDHAVTNGTYPTEVELKNKFGHDIGKLYSYAKSVHDRLPGADQRYAFSSGGIEDRIIQFLSRFAKSTRYYNLDYLVDGKNSGRSADPIAEWFTVIGSYIFATHYSPRQQERDIRNAELISAMFGQNALVSHTAEDGTPLTNVESASAQTGRNKIMQKYGTFYCAKIVRFLYVILCDVEHAAHRAGLEVPYLDEFFFPFVNDDRYLLSRKTFPPRGQ